MNNLKEILENNIDIDLKRMILSNVKAGNISKIKIRPVLIRKELVFQATLYINEKVFHENYRKQELIEKIPEWMNINFKQLEIDTAGKNITCLVSKKGKVTIKGKNKAVSDNCGHDNESLEHNRKKNYIIKPGQKVGFLEDLGVITKEGKIVNSKYDKFKQINRFLEYIEDVLGVFDEEKEITIVDFGCGKSYLTFATYYYFVELKKRKVNMIGLDLKEDVIKKCNELSEKYGYYNLKFYVGDIAEFKGIKNADMVITLHACDTATDYAINQALQWKTKVILSVPCCQHEINKQIRNDILEPVLKYGLIKERMSALITDAVRANLLEINGYDVSVIEFIDMEHTPKNILIRAIRNDKKTGDEKYQELKTFLNITPTLEKLLSVDKGENVR